VKLWITRLTLVLPGVNRSKLNIESQLCSDAKKSRRPSRIIEFSLVVVLALCGCATTVPYAPDIATTTKQLYKDTASFLEQIELTGDTSPSDYPAHVKSLYVNAETALKQLSLYADSIHDNAQRANVISLERQFKELEDYDKANGLQVNYVKELLSSDHPGGLYTTFENILILDQSEQAVNKSAGGGTGGNKPQAGSQQKQ
jgi:hypothetical protein